MRGWILLAVVTAALAVTVLAPGSGSDPGRTPLGDEREDVTPTPPASPARSPGPEPATSEGQGMGATTVTVLDDDFNSGLYTDVAMGADGNPVISYYDDSISALVLVRCADPACRDRSSTRVDDSGHTGLYTSLALHDDLPVITYYDLSNRAVRLARCADEGCRDVETTLVDRDAPELTGTAVAVAPDGSPLVAYRGGSDGALRLATCDNRTCGSVSVVELDGAGVGETVDLELTAGGAVAVTYQRGQELRLLTCRPPCTRVEPVILDAGPQAGFYPSIELDQLGAPVVAHLDFAAKQVELVRCSTLACDAATTVVADPGPLSGFFTALHLDGAGRARIAFYDEAESGLVVVSCPTLECRDPVRHVVDATPFAGQHLSFAVTGGRPALAYHDGTSRQLRFVRCSSPTCAAPPESWRPGEGIDVAATTDGRAVVVHRWVERGGVRILRCLDPACVRATATAADDLATVSGSPSVTVGPDAQPVVVFQDLVAQDLRVSRCSSTRCPFLAGRNIVRTGSVGHSPIAVWADELTLVHRDETRGRVELVRCDDAACERPSTATVATTATVGGSLAASVRPDGRVVVVYHRQGGLELRTCDRDGCGSPAALAPRSLPSPLELAVDPDGGGFVVAHRAPPSGRLELLVCALECATPETIELSDGAAHPAVVWDGGEVRVLYTLDDRTVMSRCGPARCEESVEVLPVEGQVAAVSSGGTVTVAVLAGSSPVLARCDGPRCTATAPAIVPIR